MTIKALSLWEPWASLMATGAKTIETRSWSTSYRGPLLICASQRRNKTQLNDLLEDPDFQNGLAGLCPRWPVTFNDLNFGHAVAVVDLSNVVPTSSMVLAQDEEAFGDFSNNRFGWCTRNLRRIKPFPIKGKQGLFDVDLPRGVELLEGGEG